MGNTQEELQASCNLIYELAEKHAGELLPDVRYAKDLVLAAPGILGAVIRPWPGSGFGVNENFVGNDPKGGVRCDDYWPIVDYWFGSYWGAQAAVFGYMSQERATR